MLLNMYNPIVFGYAFGLFVVSVTGFGAGPPLSTCLTLFPKHDGLEAQTSASPFIITVEEKSYSPGQSINITIRGKNGRTFIGVQIVAHRDKGDTEEFIGQYTKITEDKLKTINCIDGKKNMVGHKNNVPVTEVSVTWTAPSKNEGNLTLYISIVEEYKVFWINIPNALPSKVDIPVTPVREVKNENEIKINFDDCGKSMGCVLYPAYCTGDNCDAGASFRSEGNRTRFQIFAKNTKGYISIGWSDDRIMGSDQTISCTLNDDGYTVQHGYNPDLFNYRQYKKDQIHDMAVAWKDGKLYCEFTRPNVMSVVNMFNPSERLEFDINNDYYLMVAWGYTHKGSPAVTHHTELPFTTNAKVDFKLNKIYRGSALPTLTQVHGTLMVMAWVLFTGLATVIARFFKSSFGEKTILDVKVWFQSHRASAFVAAILTAISFIIIFVKVDGLTEVATIHAYFGIALMSLTTLQVIAGLLRPDPKSSLRPIFNWGHWLFGKLAHIIAAVSIFLAYYIDFIPKTQSLFGIISASIWVACQVLWELFFEIRNRRRNSSEAKEKVKVQKADLVLLVIYVVNMLCILAIFIMAIFFF